VENSKGRREDFKKGNLVGLPLGFYEELGPLSVISNSVRSLQRQAKCKQYVRSL